MYVVTNRKVQLHESGLDQFGKSPNDKGANELRLAKITRRGNRSYSVEFVDDVIDPGEARELIGHFKLDLDPEATHYASLKVACELTRQARSSKCDILFFVHGYNNEMRDVIDASFRLQDRYGVKLLPFSWPANGGGIAGKASYLSDKRDARASTGALERTLKKINQYLMLITESRRLELRAKSANKHPDNPIRREALFAELLDKECPFTVNAMFHSMGNYLLKQMLKSSINEGNALTFENVILCQADTNALDHASWVDRIQHNRRIFITINENDFALKASRIKPGSAQKARLGHYIKGLNSKSANYVNLTDASWVQKSHSPFGEPAEKNEKIFEFFQQAFTGQPAEQSLRYQAQGNWYEVR